MKNKIIRFCTSLLIFVLLIFILSTLKIDLQLYALAQSSLKQNINLDINDINIAPEKVSNITIPDNILPDTFDNNFEIVKEGIQYINQNGPIILRLSSDILDFGQLSPGNPVIRKVLLSVNSQYSNFKVNISENHQLKSNNQEIIPDTTCDDGLCSENVTSRWDSNLTYGFGFRLECASINCPDFAENNYYKQISNISEGEKPAVFLTGRKLNKSQDVNLMFKLNTSGSQASGSYSNIITIIVIPGY